MLIEALLQVLRKRCWFNEPPVCLPEGQIVRRLELGVGAYSGVVSPLGPEGAKIEESDPAADGELYVAVLGAI